MNTAQKTDKRYARFTTWVLPEELAILRNISGLELVGSHPDNGNSARTIAYCSVESGQFDIALITLNQHFWGVKEVMEQEAISYHDDVPKL